MQLLHTSDWHLGAMEGDRPLLEDQRFFIDQICRIIEAEGVGAVLVAGDVYDRSVASADAIRLYDYAVTRICRELGVPVLMIAGNHDSAERLANCSELLSSAGLHVCGAVEREPRFVVLDDAQVFFLPWITEEKVRSIYPEERDAIQTLEDAYEAVIQRFRERFLPGKRHVLLAHAFVTSAETSTSDRAAEIGFATQIPAAVFDGFDYVALGHIHKPQSVTPAVRYSGTPMPYSFGKEERQQKSVTLVDTKDITVRAVPLPLLHERTTVAGTLEEVLTPACSEAERNGYVRIQVTDSYVGLETYSELKKIYPNLLEVAGKTFDNPNATVTLTMQELEALETDPVEVFKYFCREETDAAADEHLIELFRRAMKEVGA